MASTTAQLIRLRRGLTFCFRRGIPKSLKANVPQHWKIFHCSVPLASVWVWFGLASSVVQIAESSISVAIKICNMLVYSLWQQVLELPSLADRNATRYQGQARPGTAVVSLVAVDKLVLVQCLI